jgi:hypothetical protein
MFWISLRGILHWRDRPHRSILAEELVTRFVIASRHIDKSRNRIKYAAFIPERFGDPSLYRIDGCDETKIWWLARTFVQPFQRAGRGVKARGDLEVSEFLSRQLRLTARRLPHPRHAETFGWPLSKHEQLGIAEKLARATLTNLVPGKNA